VNPWSRGVTSLTGRLSRRAAMAMSAVRGVVDPLAPNAPPIKWLTTRTFSGSIPSCSATPFFKPQTIWLGSQTVSWGPDQKHVVVKSSIGLWWVGVLYSASIFTSAEAKAPFASPTLGSSCSLETSATGWVVMPGESNVALGVSAA
jgi:hypothetical protein